MTPAQRAALQQLRDGDYGTFDETARFSTRHGLARDGLASPDDSGRWSITKAGEKAAKKGGQ